jgi:hypothetical protein
MEDGIPALFTYNGSNWMFAFGAERYALAFAPVRSLDAIDGDPNMPLGVECLLLNQTSDGSGVGRYWSDAPWDAGGAREILELIEAGEPASPVDFSNARLAEGIGIDYDGTRLLGCGRHFLYPNPDGDGILLVTETLGGADVTAFATNASRPVGSWTSPNGWQYRYAADGDTGELVQLAEFSTGAKSLGLLTGLGGVAEFSTGAKSLGLLTGLGGVAVTEWNNAEDRPSGILAVLGGAPALAGMADDTPCDHSLAACRRRANRQRFGGFAGIGSGGLLE